MQVESETSNSAEYEEQLKRDSRVFELRVQGLTFEQIAQEVGFSGPSGAWQAYKRIRERLIFEPLEELRQLELMRLDAVQHALWDRAIEGDLPAANCVLKIMDLRAKLVGLYKPERVELSKWNFEAGDVDAEVERIIKIMNEREEEFMARRESEVRAEMRAQFEVERKLEKELAQRNSSQDAKAALLAVINEKKYKSENQTENSEKRGNEIHEL
jgi:hypothetical protein